MNRILQMDKGVGLGTLQTHTKTLECESLCLCLRCGERSEAEEEQGAQREAGNDGAKITGAML